MSRFDHVLVMVSVIIGLGVTRFLEDLGSLIQRTATLQIYLPHCVFAVVAFVALVQLWWAIRIYREVPDESWTYPEYVLVLLSATFIFLVSELALPGSSSSELNLKKHFEVTSTWFFVCLAIYVVLVLALRKRLRGIAVLSRSNVPRLVGLAAVILAAGTSAAGLHSVKVHTAIALIFAILLGAFLWRYNPWFDK